MKTQVLEHAQNHLIGNPAAFLNIQNMLCSCRHTETTMQRVLSLNHALVESFAEPLILATCRQQQLQAAPDPASSVPRRAEASASHHHRRQTDAEEGTFVCRPKHCRTKNVSMMPACMFESASMQDFMHSFD